MTLHQLWVARSSLKPITSRTGGQTAALGLIPTRLFAFGARSFSIWDAQGKLVFDSGDAFEREIARARPANFNANNSANTFDNRSDNKVPEPEGVALGKIDSRTYAFIGLERQGGVMIFDVSEPRTPILVQYLSTAGTSRWCAL